MSTGTNSNFPKARTADLITERVGDELRINAPNCVDCKATDVLGPRWTPREGGSGPKYRSM